MIIEKPNTNLKLHRPQVIIDTKLEPAVKSPLPVNSSNRWSSGRSSNGFDFSEFRELLGITAIIL